MDNFAIDLDSVLNELERQESIEDFHLKDIFKLKEELIFSTKTKSKILNNQIKSDLENWSSINENDSGNEISSQHENNSDNKLEDELNEIINSSIFLSPKALLQNDEPSIKKYINPCTPTDHEENDSVKEEKNLSIFINEDNENLHDQVTDYLENHQIHPDISSINSESSKIYFLLNTDLDKPDKLVKENIIAGDIPSPNEDSQTFFDTIESPSNFTQEYFPLNLKSTQVENITPVSCEQVENITPVSCEQVEIYESTDNELISLETKNNEININATNEFLFPINTDKEKETDEKIISESEVFVENDELQKESNGIGYNYNQPDSEEFTKELEAELESLTLACPIETSNETAIAQNETEQQNFTLNNSHNEEQKISHSELATNSLNSNEVSENIPVLSVAVENSVPIEVIDFETEWAQLTDSEKMLGIIAPVWLNDSEAENCMKCNTGFTFRKRRHHCRACGLIFCSDCCYSKLALTYTLSGTNPTMNDSTNDLGSKSRVCNVCYDTITKVNQLKVDIQKNPRITTLIKPVLKKKSNSNSTSTNTLETIKNECVNEDGEAPGSAVKLIRSKSVRFSDGFIPGTDPTAAITTLSDSLEQASQEMENINCSETETKKTNKKSSKKHRTNRKLQRNMFHQSRFIEEEIINRVKNHQIVNKYLPPILTNKGEIVDFSDLNEEAELIQKKLLANESDGCLTFLLLKNLKVHVRIVNLDLSNPGKSWLFTTQGLCVNGQDEIVFILKCLVDPETQELTEKHIPRQFFYHIFSVYENSLKAYRVMSMSHVLYDSKTVNPDKHLVEFQRNAKNSTPDKSSCSSEVLFGNQDNVGFFYFRPTEFHSRSLLSKIQSFLPDENFLVSFLIQKQEIPWAKLFPLRLYLKLGEEFNTYPCSLVSDRYRKPVFGEIGQTILSLLCDVRNFQYTIAQIDGLSICLKEGASLKIIIPKSQYDLIIKSLLTSNEYVFSLAKLNVENECSSHLVTLENKNLGTYLNKKMSSINSSEDSDKGTGVAFIVFNGALKPNLTLNAKQSIIEDGVMIQIESETLNKLKLSLQQMKPFEIECNKPPHTTSSTKTISIEWTKNDDYINPNVFSVIDRMPMQGIKSIRLNTMNDYVNETKSIRWIEIFLIQISEDEPSESEHTSFNLNAFADLCAQTFCMGIVPLLDDLIKMQLNNLLEKKKIVANGISVEEEINSNQCYIDPFKIGLRVQLNKDQVGYLIGMNGNLITHEAFLSSLDNELIQILHHTNTSNINVLLEFSFCVQERFNCDNTFLFAKK